MAMSSGLRRKGLLLSFCHCSHRSSALLGILDHSSRQSLLHHRNRVVVARHTITTTMMSSSATPGPDAVGRQQRDERISDDKIFFIELGFGNDSHGQVRRCSAFISLFAPPISFVFFVRTMRCSAGRMAESMSSPRRVQSPHTILTRSRTSHAMPIHPHCGAVVHQGRRQGVSQRHRIQLHPVHQAPDPRRECDSCPRRDVYFVFCIFSCNNCGCARYAVCTQLTGRIRRPEARRPTRRAAEISRGVGPGRGGESFPLRRRQIRDPG